MDKEIADLIALLKQTFTKGAWHGPSVLEALEDVTEEQAFRKLPETHSIIELVGHMTAWRLYTCKKLQGDATYKVTQELNFPKQEDWRQTLSDLEESQRQLVAALEKFSAGQLEEDVPGTATPLKYYTLVHAIIHHDLYHTGQIVLLKKAAR